MVVEGSGVDAGAGVGGRNFGAVVWGRLVVGMGGEERIGREDEGSKWCSSPFAGCSGGNCWCSSWDMMEEVDRRRRLGERSSIL